MTTRFWLAALLVCVLTACGGGGGGDSGGGFSLSTQKIDFFAVRNSSAPEPQRLRMQITGKNVAYAGAAFQHGPKPSWLHIEILGVAPELEVKLTVTTTSLPMGEYSSILSVGTADADGDILEVKDIAVRYQVESRLQIVTAPMQHSLTLGSPPATLNATIGVSAQGLRYRATSNATWAAVPDAISRDDGSVPVMIDGRGLKAGQYSAKITLTNVDKETESVSQQVHLTVRKPTMQIATSPISASFTFGHSTSTLISQVQVNGDQTGFIARSSAPWLSAPSGTLSGPGTFPITIDAVGLGVGNHTGKLTLTNIHDESVVATLAVSVVVLAPEIRLSATSLSLGGPAGHDADSAQLEVALGTGDNAYPWTVTAQTESGVDWLAVTGGGGTLSPTPKLLQISARRGLLSSGPNRGDLTIRATVKGRVFSTVVPTTANMASNRLFVSSLGVAFAKFPSRELLSRELVVEHSEDLTDIGWQASSSQNWLKVMPSGITGGKLRLTAETANLQPNRLYRATVTVSSPVAAVENSPRINVGLWISDSDPEDRLVELSAVSGTLEPSPVDPYVFIADYNGKIAVHNVYTGELVRTYTGLVSSISTMRVSPDGDTLYIDDYGKDRVLAVDLASGQIVATFPFYRAAHSGLTAIRIVRPRGYPLLCLTTSEELAVYDLENGPLVHHIPGFLEPAALTPNHRGFYAGNYASPGGTVTRYSLDYSGVLTTPIEFRQLGSIMLAEGARGMAVSPDGQRVYVDGGGRLYILDAQLYVLNSVSTNPAPASVESLWNGLYFTVGDAAQGSTLPDIYIYRADGSVLQAYSSYYSHYASLGYAKISGDAIRLITEVFFSHPETPRLVLTTVPAN